MKFKICSKYADPLLFLKFRNYMSKIEKLIKGNVLISLQGRCGSVWTHSWQREKYCVHPSPDGVGPCGPMAA